MRFKSKKVGGYQVFAVAGTNTVSFGIDAKGADTKGLLGFAVERKDHAENKQFFMRGFKVFESVVPKPNAKTQVSTLQHPIQSFVWDDFTGNEGRAYTYTFHPLKGTPKKLDRTSKPISITVETEKQVTDKEHDIFFNRGVASSQAYTREFGNTKLSKLPPAKREKAKQWLSRELDEAILRFIDNAKAGDTLLCCFYEFRYEPVAAALARAIKRKVKVKIIFDAKVNGTINKKTGKKQESFPREENLAVIKNAGIPAANVIPREAKPNNIQHNKFMILLKGAAAVPSEVWTGSTNISEGGIFGQTNVGHWVRNKTVAKQFKAYWDLLSKDPGPKKGEDTATAKKKNAALREAVDKLGKLPAKWKDFPKGITPIFSPRTGKAVLQNYAKMNDEAAALSCITLAFGINAEFKNLLRDNTNLSHLGFLLLEKEDKPNPKSKDPFVALNAKNNIYKAWGSFLRDGLYQWTKETNAGILGLNKHVSYIHSKFLLVDPLSANPIVVTGSANFSAASTNDNDENMIVIRGETRVADIYFSEFNRLFFHYYFRSVQEATARVGRKPVSLFLDETDGWLKKYAPGLLRTKRVAVYTGMEGAKQG